MNDEQQAGAGHEDQGKRYRGAIVAASAVASAAFTSLVAWLSVEVTGAGLFALLIPVCELIAAAIPLRKSSTVESRSVRMGVLIGAPFAFLVAGNACLNGLANSL